jgi:hypothetical protein
MFAQMACCILARFTEGTPDDDAQIQSSGCHCCGSCLDAWLYIDRER